MTKTTMPLRMPSDRNGHRADGDARRQLVGPGLDVAGLEPPHQQDQRQEHQHDHHVDGDADDQAKLVERGFLIAGIGRQPAPDRSVGETALLADRPRRQEADIGSDQDGAGDHDLQRDEDGQADIAEQRRRDGEKAERNGSVAQPCRPGAPAFVSRLERFQQRHQDQDDADDDRGDKTSGDGQRQRRAHLVVDHRQEIVDADDNRHGRRQPHQPTRRTGLDRYQAPVRQPRLQRRIGQPVDAEHHRDDGSQRVEEDADIAAQDIVIIEQEDRRSEEGADRQCRQQCRPERHRQPAEIGRILDRRIGFEDTPEQAAAADQQHRCERERHEGRRQHRLELELEGKAQPGRHRPVKVDVFVLGVGERPAGSAHRTVRSAWSAGCGTARCACCRSCRSGR